MEIFTAGFTKWTAEGFFETLKREGIERLIDVRLHNTSQLAGFAKRDDLAYFLRVIDRVDYVHEPLLAPTPELLEAYKKRRMTWDAYEAEFGRLMSGRQIEDRLHPDDFGERALLLCSEHEPDRCHRRLVAEHLSAQWRGVEIVHLPR